jgi:4'-phosphopantetheinyl transferase EntD
MTTAGREPAGGSEPPESAVGAVAARWAVTMGAHAAAGPVRGMGRSAERAASDEIAARLLSVLGEAPARALQRSAAGRPLWPAAVRASLSHAAGVAIGLAARHDRWQAVGVDLEVEGALPLVDAVAVLSAEERRVADRLGIAPGEGRGAPDGSPPGRSSVDVGATRLWSAKEAGFKAWCGALDDDLPGIDPLEVQVWPGVDGGTFALRCHRSLAARVGSLGPMSGRWLPVPGTGLVLTVVWR